MRNIQIWLVLFRDLNSSTTLLSSSVVRLHLPLSLSPCLSPSLPPPSLPLQTLNLCHPIRRMLSFSFSPWINYQREAVLLHGKRWRSPLLEMEIKAHMHTRCYALTHSVGAEISGECVYCSLLCTSGPSWALKGSCDSIWPTNTQAAAKKLVWEGGSDILWLITPELHKHTHTGT